MTSRFSGLLQAPSKFVFREDEPEESVTPSTSKGPIKRSVAVGKREKEDNLHQEFGVQPERAAPSSVNKMHSNATSMVHSLKPTKQFETQQNRATASKHRGRSPPVAGNVKKITNGGSSAGDSSDSGDGFVYKRQHNVAEALGQKPVGKRKRMASPKFDQELEEARDNVAKLRARKRVMLGQAEAVGAELVGVVRKMKDLEEESRRLTESKNAIDTEISTIDGELQRAKSFLEEREKESFDLVNSTAKLERAVPNASHERIVQKNEGNTAPNTFVDRVYAETNHPMQATSAAGYSEPGPRSSSLQATNVATAGSSLNRRNVACLMERPIHQFKPRRIKISPWAPHLIASCSYYEKACGIDEAVKVYTSSTSSPQVLPGTKQDKYGRVVDIAWIGPETLAVGTLEPRCNLWIWNMKKVGKSKYVVRDTPVAYKREDPRYCMSARTEGIAGFGTLAVGGADKTITVIKTPLQPTNYQAPSAVVALTTKHSNAVHDVCFNHGNFIYSGGDDGRICVTDFERKTTWEYAKLLRTADQAASLVKTNFIKFNPTDKNMLLTGSHGRDPVHLRLWDVRQSSNGGPRMGISIPDLEDISLYSRPIWSPCGRYIAVGLNMGLCITDIRKSGQVFTWPHPGNRPFGLAWHPAERTIFDVSFTAKSKYKLFGHHY